MAIGILDSPYIAEMVQYKKQEDEYPFPNEDKVDDIIKETQHII